MTEFNLRVEVEYNLSSEYHSDGRAEIELTFDPESREAFYKWLASGCKDDLILNKDGCKLSHYYVNEQPPSGTQTIPLYRPGYDISCKVEGIQNALEDVKK